METALRYGLAGRKQERDTEEFSFQHHAPPGQLPRSTDPNDPDYVAAGQKHSEQ